jgi:NitT/TauT family transport system substrate-binding protein
MANPDIRLLFLKKEIDAAWVPEPWLTILHQEGGGEVVVDEKSLWADGRFVTTQIIASSAFLDRSRDLARRVVAAHVELTEWINGHPAEAKTQVNAALAAETGKPMKVELIDEAWARIHFTADPYPAGVEEMARRAFELGFLGTRPPDLKRLIDASLLRKEP